MMVLVTGATGFSGTALIRYLLSQGERDIYGMSRSPMPSLLLKTGAQMVLCDLLDASQLIKVVREICPERIIHLAGMNRGSLDELLTANVTATRNLLDAVNDVNPLCRTLVVSSSAVYGYVGKKLIDENTPIRPLADYGTSKAAEEQVVLERHANGSAQISIARPFNLVGPGQPDSFLCGRIVRQVVEIEQGKRETLELLETRSYRDFIDVRDVVKAYWALVSHPDYTSVCAGQIFNISSETAHAVSEVISLVEDITGKSYIVSLPENPPVIPIPFQVGDCKKVKNVAGWRPEISLKESLTEMLAAARSGKK